MTNKFYIVYYIVWAFLIGGLLLTGCEAHEPKGDNDVISSSNYPSHTHIKCIDGVAYIVIERQIGTRGFGFMSVKFNRDGTIALCEQGE